jgi:hypothetical protein
MTTTTFIKSGNERYDVIVDGLVMGYTLRSWDRIRGWGWRARCAATGREQSFKTRRDAGAFIAREMTR